MTCQVDQRKNNLIAQSPVSPSDFPVVWVLHPANAMRRKKMFHCGRLELRGVPWLVPGLGRWPGPNPVGRD